MAEDSNQQEVETMIPRFECSETGLRDGKAYLEEHGYAVFKEVISKDDIEDAKNLFWDFIEGIPDRLELDLEGRQWPCREDSKTWENQCWPGDPRTGIFAAYGAGQSPFSWFLRTRPKVKEVFASIWETDDLVTSFDGFNAFRPWYDNEKWKTEGGWFHLDQNPALKPDKECIQGLVSLYDTTAGTGGLTVVPGSHTAFREVWGAEELERLRGLQRLGGNGDYVHVPEGHRLLGVGGGPRLVACRAGDLCLWDSRTVHCNQPGAAGRPAAAGAADNETQAAAAAPGGAAGGGARRRRRRGELLRLVSYVCMTPARRLRPAVAAARAQAVAERVSTSHWPHECVPSCRPSPAFPEHPWVDPELVAGRGRRSSMAGCAVM